MTTRGVIVSVCHPAAACGVVLVTLAETNELPSSGLLQCIGWGGITRSMNGAKPGGIPCVPFRNLTQTLNVSLINTSFAGRGSDAIGCCAITTVAKITEN